MRSDWITCKVSELAEVIGGGTPSTKNEDYYGGEISWITPKDLSGHTNQYISEGGRSITKLGLEKSSAKLMPAGSILFSSRAPIGYVAIAAKPLSTNQGFKSLVPNKEKLDSLFGYYLMKFYAPEIERHASGSTFKEVSGAVVKNFEVKVPKSLETQRKVASVLASLDDKIANNKAMNQTLEKLAQRIFKSWFIDFDPVKANKEGLPFDGLSPEIQALFPSEFEDSELGMIPKGWEVSTIKQLQEKLSKGTTPRKKDVESAQDAPSIPFIKVRNISDTGSIESELETVASSIHEGALKRSILQSEDLLFTIAGTIGRVAIVPDTLNNSNCNQAVCFIRLKDKPTYNNYLYLHLKSKRIQEQISSKVVQAVQANASLQNINDINFPLPTNKLMESWNKVTLPLFDRIKEIEKQNITLTRLRDRLLPKLVSGQISVGEATQELAEAV
ncbi:restriction endonuclease subunit S [Vibrio campbellii]|uniref:restriction endonuclease subunit S n=1 Tax=Vibrio campbellii TaxID=680 RepID=UPI001560F2FC|nr:restriction endonuclease subunit S [Vibrio campbellii]